VFQAPPLLAQDIAVQGSDPGLLVVVGSGLLALLLSLIIWPIVRFAITLAHEGGHAFTASLMGGAVDSIHLYRNDDSRGRGKTYFRDVGPFGRFWTALAGYLGPSAFGLLGVVLLVYNRVNVVLWLSLVFLVLALMQSGNLLGFVTSVATGAIVVMVLKYGSPGQETLFAYTWIWFLLFGGFGHVIAVLSGSGDAHELRAMTFLPVSLWSGFFWLTTLGALVYGGGVLLGVVNLPDTVAR
jgi:hypothetical protein